MTWGEIESTRELTRGQLEIRKGDRVSRGQISGLFRKGELVCFCLFWKAVKDGDVWRGETNRTLVIDKSVVPKLGPNGRVLFNTDDGQFFSLYPEGDPENIDENLVVYPFGADYTWGNSTATRRKQSFRFPSA